MKATFTITFLILFLVTNTALGQILRLPTLLHHYAEHVEWDNYTFYEFMSEHYAKKINHPDDSHNDHENLPFKATDCQIIPLISLLAASTDFARLTTPTILKDEEVSLFHQNISSVYLSNIWQPPRFS